MRRRRIGLRPRIAAVASLVVGLALTIAAFALLALLRSRLDSAATTAATLRARDIASLASAGALPHPLALPGEESALVQVVNASGAVIASTGNIDGEPAISTRRPADASPLTFTQSVPALNDTQDMRLVAITVQTSNGVVTVYAGESLEQSQQTVSTIATVLLLGVSVLVAIVAAVTWWAVGRTLRPVRAITETMAEITAHDLHRRVPAAVTNDEIGQLATTVNKTLTRLDSSVEQQRRFVADASHELRGPIAALRADLEISLAHPQRTNWQAVARDTLGDVERLQRLTEDLLVLARTDEPAQNLPMQLVDLAEAARGCIDDIRRNDITVNRHGLEHPAMLLGHEQQLRRMIRNLIDNAENHTASRIDVTIERLEQQLRLVIADDGPGIPAAERRRVLERFIRLDHARTRDSGGTGLGLAIVQGIVDTHHGTISIAAGETRGTTIAVELPVPAASHDGSIHG